MSDVKSNPSGTQSLDRGLSVLFTVADSPHGKLSLAECTEILGHSKATTLRMLQTLARRDLLSYDAATQMYSLGPATIALGAQYLDQIDIRKIARPHMEALVAATNETAHLGVLRGPNVVYVEVVENDEPIRIFSRVGDAIEAHASSTGKALLAWLEPDDIASRLPESLTPRTPRTITDVDALLDEFRRSKARGYTSDIQENRDGVTGYGVPIFDHEHRVVAAVSLGGPSERITADMEPRLTTELQMTARAISLELGASPHGLPGDPTPIDASAH